MASVVRMLHAQALALTPTFPRDTGRPSALSQDDLRKLTTIVDQLVNLNKMLNHSGQDLKR